MFSKMLDKGVSPVLVRLLIYIYSHQVANVRWNGEYSRNFSVRNGCGQGKVLAAIAYCLYCEELFETLRRRHSGCWVRGYYRGIFGYSDDNWVLAPSLHCRTSWRLVKSLRHLITLSFPQIQILVSARQSVWPSSRSPGTYPPCFSVVIPSLGWILWSILEQQSRTR